MSPYRWVYHPRNFWAAVPLFFALISNYDEIEFHWLTWGLGGAVFLTGLAIRIWSQQHLRYRMNTHKMLTTTGPYGLVRNPLYIANALTYAGATICSELVWLAPLAFFWAIGVYSFVVRHEEKQLSEKYGDAYRRYLEEIPRWVPNKMRSAQMGLINEFLGKALFAELPCLLILVPYIIKDFLF